MPGVRKTSIEKGYGRAIVSDNVRSLSMESSNVRYSENKDVQLILRDRKIRMSDQHQI